MTCVWHQHRSNPAKIISRHGSEVQEGRGDSFSYRKRVGDLYVSNIGKSPGKDHVDKVTHKQVTGKQGQECYRCGGTHEPVSCKFKDANCYNCNKKGHTGKKCRSTRKKSTASQEPGKNHAETTQRPSENKSCSRSRARQQRCLCDVSLDKRSSEVFLDKHRTLWENASNGDRHGSVENNLK